MKAALRLTATEAVSHYRLLLADQRHSTTSPHKPPLPPRMMLSMQRLEPFTRHMGVDGGGGDIGMAQQYLHHTQISAVVEQVCGKRVAQRVW